MVKHALVVLQTKRMLALWTVILLLVPAALLGKLYKPFICTQHVSRLSTPFTRYQLRHELPNIERPLSYEIESNGFMNFLLRVVSLKHNLLSTTFLAPTKNGKYVRRSCHLNHLEGAPFLVKC